MRVKMEMDSQTFESIRRAMVNGMFTCDLVATKTSLTTYLQETAKKDSDNLKEATILFIQSRVD